jgi:hypothetical protein
MPDGQPELIPMPGESGPAPNPADITRQLSPEEERSVLLNFMGNMYGEAKKMDGNIIAPSSTLQRGKSEELKKQIEQVYTQPQQPASQVQVAPPQPEEPIQQPVEPVRQVVRASVEDNDQLSFNFNVTEKEELFNSVERVLARLDRLHQKVDKIEEQLKNFSVTSLPIKRQTKKKSVEKKEEI